jgi:hypothetical protein
MVQEIFVFGSNLQGRHGRGAALDALKFYGAQLGIGEGPQGNSYAIPTKITPYKTLPLKDIQAAVERFKVFAGLHPEVIFNVTAVGCGLAGYTPEQIAPMFKGSPANCRMPDRFTPFLGED